MEKSLGKAPASPEGAELRELSGQSGALLSPDNAQPCFARGLRDLNTRAGMQQRGQIPRQAPALSPGSPPGQLGGRVQRVPPAPGAAPRTERSCWHQARACPGRDERQRGQSLDRGRAEGFGWRGQKPLAPARSTPTAFISKEPFTSSGTQQCWEGGGRGAGSRCRDPAAATGRKVRQG